MKVPRYLSEKTFRPSFKKNAGVAIFAAISLLAIGAGVTALCGHAGHNIGPFKFLNKMSKTSAIVLTGAGGAMFVIDMFALGIMKKNANSFRNKMSKIGTKITPEEAEKLPKPATFARGDMVFVPRSDCSYSLSYITEVKGSMLATIVGLAPLPDNPSKTGYLYKEAWTYMVYSANHGNYPPNQTADFLKNLA